MLGIEEPDVEILDTVAFVHEVRGGALAQGLAEVVVRGLAAGVGLRLASWSWTPGRHCAHRRRSGHERDDPG